MAHSGYVYFIDESFGARDSWCEQVLPVLGGLPFAYGCQSNLKFMNPRKLALMAAAGFESIEFGFETGSQDILSLAKKDNALGAATETISAALELGLNPLLFILVGLPGESKETLAETVKFLRGLPRGVRASVALPTPYPGTALFLQGEQQGKIRHKRGLDLYQYAGTIGHNLKVNLAYRTAFLSQFGPNWVFTDQSISSFEDGLVSLFSN